LAGFLLINPRAGRRSVSVEELAAAAGERGVRTHVLEPGEAAAGVAAEAAGGGAEAIGIAGGDGSLATVAEVAIESDLPFVCVPFGTRNHFARDLGLERRDPVAALEAFAGRERRIDVGRAGERLFLNNVSIGAYASLVHGRKIHHRRRESVATARALLRTLRHPHQLQLPVDGEVIVGRVVLVANNAYELKLFELGARKDLTAGRLYLYSAPGLLPTDWHERVGERFELGRAGTLHAAIDGEALELETPVVCRVEPAALRVLVPPGR
jgi:diacylglycerol kinase family enzyme